MRGTRKAWGYHLIVNAGNCDHDAIRSKSTIASFAKTLVKKIDMAPYGPPRVYRFGNGALSGLSLVQLIQTSNITAHFDEVGNDAYFDIFSCKSFEPKKALSVIQEVFAPGTIDTTFMRRQARHKRDTRRRA